MTDLIAGRYRLNEEIGAGGMGTVFRGVESHRGEVVAIKVLRPQVVRHDSSMVERFSREGEVLRRLNHPNIVKMLAAETQNGQHYIIMEYVAGGSLFDLLQREGRLAPERVLMIALELADALSRAHHLNIIHRDLKPANVLLAADGTPRLTDFGIAYMSERERLTQIENAVGTLNYMPPESLEPDMAYGDIVDPRSDIWAFGVMLFEMLVGQRPFDDHTFAQMMRAILTQPVPDLESLCPDAPVGLVDLIYRMLEKDRNLRIPSMRQVGAQLEAVLQGYAVPLHFEALPTGRFVTPPPTGGPNHNLPTQTTPFVGREQELAELLTLLDTPAIRLMTILGSGGMGKTRLACEVAERVLDTRRPGSSQASRFPHGVWFVDLAPLSTAEPIVSAIADAIGYQFQRDDRHPQQQLLDYLDAKQMLLLLDNFEHLLDSIGVLSAILESTHAIRFIVTSRERLRLNEETLYRIEGIEYPEWTADQDTVNSAAVRLFAQSARRAQSGFEINADDSPYVARICQLVQGMPLAIILAAAWVEMLSLDEIAEEIATSLDILETVLQNIPQRQRSVRAVFDSTWNRLNDDERSIFTSLSVFRGGYTRQAAEAVTGANLRVLTALVHKSLMRRDRDGRYTVHELLRQYAEEHLRESPKNELAIRDRYSAYYAAYVGEWGRGLRSGHQLEGLSAIETELDNIRSVWHWVTMQGKVEAMSDLAEMWDFFEIRCRYQEGIEFFRFALEEWRGQKSSIAYGKLLAGQSALLFRLSMLEEMIEHANKSINILTQVEGERYTILPLLYLGNVATMQGNLVEGERLYNEAYAIAERYHHSGMMAMLQGNLSIVAEKGGNLELAKERLEKQLAISKEIGDQMGTALAQLNLGDVAKRQSNFDESTQHYQDSITVAQTVNQQFIIAAALKGLGELARYRRQFKEAKRLIQEGLAINRENGDRYSTIKGMNSLTAVAFAEGNNEESWQWFQEAIAAARELGADGFTLETLMSVAPLLLSEGYATQAVEVLVFILHHPSTTQDVKDQIETLHEELEAELAPEMFAAAMERGKSLELTDVVRNLLDKASAN